MPSKKNSLRVTQFIRGERKKVFQAWTDAATAKGHEDGWASALRNLAKQFP